MLIIKKLRLQKGWSQAELAEFSGLSIRTIQRIERGANPGLESLKCLASVFEKDIADLQQEDNMEGKDLSIEERRAFEHVQGMKEYYIHLLSYIIIIPCLFIVNYLTSPEYIWAKWPAIGWGIGIIMHGLRTFDLFTIFGPEWEKKQIEKRLGRKL